MKYIGCKFQDVIGTVRSYFTRTEKSYKIFAIWLPILCMALLTIPNLGSREMWFDEAHNVAISENILKFGVPKVWDGTNLIGLGEDSYVGFIEVFLNWFPYYLAALGQIFSKSLFFVRIWFVICGLLSAICLYFMTYENFKNRRLALLALWLYCLSVPVIIYIKVAYYYAPALLFINASYLFFLKSMNTGKTKYFALFVVSMVLLLYSNYLFFTLFTVFLLLIYLFCYRRFLSKIFKSFVFIMLLIAPYVLSRVYHSFMYGYGYQRQGLSGLLLQFPGYIWQVQAYFSPIITFLLMFILKGIYGLFKKNQYPLNDSIKKNSNVNKHYYFFVLLVILNIFAISVLTLDYATRYLIVSIPFLYILNASFILWFFKKDNLAIILFVAIFVTTNIIHEAPYFLLKNTKVNDEIKQWVRPPVAHYESMIVTDLMTLDQYIESLKINSLFFTYINSYSKDYDCSEEGAVLFLKRFAKDNDTFTCLTISKYQILYHTDLNLVQFENSDSKIMNEEYIGLGKPITWATNLKYYSHIYTPIEFIDWVVVNPDDIKSGGNEFVPKEICEILLDEDLFERYDLPEYTCVPFSADIWSYTFETDLSYQGVTIFRNKKTTDEINSPNIVTKQFLEGIE